MPDIALAGMSRMKLIAIFAVALPMFSEQGWPQSVADAARAAREQKAASARRVITNDDLDNRTVSFPRTQWEREVERMKSLLRDVCADPATNEGRNLSEADLKSLYEAAKPIYDRRLAMEKKLREWKTTYRNLEEEEQKAMAAAAPKEGFTQEDGERFRAIHEDYQSQRNVILINAQGDAESFEQLKKELTDTAAACPKAVDSLK